MYAGFSSLGTGTLGSAGGTSDGCRFASTAGMLSARSTDSSPLSACAFAIARRAAPPRITACTTVAASASDATRLSLRAARALLVGDTLVAAVAVRAAIACDAD
eukprot:scaffold21244_cov60-Phaeocystis_antarctica.AAC.6